MHGAGTIVATDRAGPDPKEAYVFVSYLKEGRALPCPFSTSDK